jgi:Protein of unknown function (DUF1501)
MNTLTRHDFLNYTGKGLGAIALTQLFHNTQANSNLDVKATHFPARAKNVIFFSMKGAPSHVDTFDYKPKLNQLNGKAGPKPGSKLLGSKWSFKPHGKSGLYFSELFPNLAQCADDILMIHSMQTEVPAHPQAYIKMHTGTSQFIRPSLGSWALYGLGTINQNLPGFLSITPPSGFGGTQNYGSAFLPAIFQGSPLGNDHRPVKSAQLNDITPKTPLIEQRQWLDQFQKLNQQKLAPDSLTQHVQGVIDSFELAFKMQSEFPKVLDLSKESPQMLKNYGIDQPHTEDFGRKCLMARRFIEAGVRFVEVTHGNWDHHFNLSEKLPASCAEIDLPLKGLLNDLKQRGLLKDTIVIWTGEFGRTPYAEGDNGRDHNTKAFTTWIAGGGFKGGAKYGQSDEIGYEAVDSPVSIHDFHATLLAALGLNHEKLTYRHAGRDFRLTDVHGTILKSWFS